MPSNQLTIKPFATSIEIVNIFTLNAGYFISKFGIFFFSKAGHAVMRQ